MPTQRSSSGVRDLRAIFEDKSDTAISQDRDRGRSPGGSTPDVDSGSAIENHSNSAASSRTRKVTTTFVPVEAETSNMSADRRDNVAVDVVGDKDATNEVKQTVPQDVEQPQNIPAQTKTVPEVAETSSPASQAVGTTQPRAVANVNGSKEMTLPTEETQSEHQEKLVSAVKDEEDVELETADVKTTEATAVGDATRKEEPVSSPSALNEPSPSANADAGHVAKNAQIGTTANGSASKAAVGTATEGVDTSRSEQRKSTTAKPFALDKSAKPSTLQSVRSQVASSTKSPRETNATASSHTPPKRSPTQPARLPSHLMAPTASSAAKHEPEPGPTNTRAHTKKSGQLSSHLMAPTAASAAKHEVKSDASGTGTTNLPKNSSVAKRDRTSLASTTGTRTASARTSLANATKNPKPASGRASLNSSGKPPTGDFLERMMRPTAASSSKNHEKVETKSPPRTSKTATGKVKPTGTTKITAGTSGAGNNETIVAHENTPTAVADDHPEHPPVYRLAAVGEAGMGSTETPEMPKTPEKSVSNLNLGTAHNAAQAQNEIDKAVKMAETPNFKGETIH